MSEAKPTEQFKANFDWTVRQVAIIAFIVGCIINGPLGWLVGIIVGIGAFVVHALTHREAYRQWAESARRRP